MALIIAVGRSIESSKYASLQLFLDMGAAGFEPATSRV